MPLFIFIPKGMGRSTSELQPRSLQWDFLVHCAGQGLRFLSVAVRRGMGVFETFKWYSRAFWHSWDKEEFQLWSCRTQNLGWTPGSWCWWYVLAKGGSPELVWHTLPLGRWLIPYVCLSLALLWRPHDKLHLMSPKKVEGGDIHIE